MAVVFLPAGNSVATRMVVAAAEIKAKRDAMKRSEVQHCYNRTLHGCC